MIGSVLKANQWYFEKIDKIAVILEILLKQDQNKDWK